MREHRVAIYGRVACADQLEMDEQEKALREYAVRNHYRNLRFYHGNGHSGLQLDDRPGFQQLCEDIATGKVDAVLVRNISRIGRRYADILPWLDGLERMGVTLIAADAVFRPPGKWG